MSSAPVIPIEEASKIREQVALWPMRAAELEVTNAEGYQAGAELLRQIKSLLGEIDSTFDPIVKATHAAHKEALEQKKKHANPLSEADTAIRRKMARFQAEQERIRREQAAIEAAQARAAREKAEREAQELAEMGEAEMAEAVRQSSEIENAPPIPEPAPKADGISTRKNWKARVTDLDALVKAVAAGDVPIGAIQADMRFLSLQAKALEKELKIPGVESYNDVGITVR